MTSLHANFHRLVLDPRTGICATASTFSDLKRLFKTSGASTLVTRALHELAPVKQLAPTDTVLSCCNEQIALIRQDIASFSDLKILVFQLVADEIAKLVGSGDDAQSGTTQQQQQQQLTTSLPPSRGAKRRSRFSDSSEQQQQQQNQQPPPPQQQNQQQQNQQHVSNQISQQRATFFTNVIGLLYGLVFPTNTTKQPVACASLVQEKNLIMNSDEYNNMTNAAERRKAMQSTVLCVFSDKGQRHHFSRVWTNVMSTVLASTTTGCGDSNKSSTQLTPQQQLHVLSLHLLTDVNNAIIPWLTNPLLLSESLSEAYRGGGLLAVLALEGLLTLIISHGLEYPRFYTGLYALVTPDVFSSPHRHRFFRLLDLSMKSIRVPAAIAASFIKRLARCALMCPSPALYFALPFIRQKLQQHSNCFALIHRSLRDVEEAEEDLLEEEKKFQQKKISNSGKNPALQQESQRVERLKQVFEGVDPFNASEPDPEKSNAIDSTLWELATLERHMLPAVRNGVAAFASPAEDTQPLQFERSYARLFSHALSMTESQSVGCTVTAPPSRKAFSLMYSSTGGGGRNDDDDDANFDFSEMAVPEEKRRKANDANESAKNDDGVFGW